MEPRLKGQPPSSWQLILSRWTHAIHCITAKRAANKGRCSVWQTCDWTKLTTLATVNIFELQRATCRKSAILTYPTCIWCLHWGDPFEFCRDIRHKKTVVPGVLCGVVCIILCLAVSVEHRLVTHFCNLNQNKQHCCWVKLTPADSFQSLLSAILTYKPGSMFMMHKLAMSLYGLTIQPCSVGSK